MHNNVVGFLLCDHFYIPFRFAKPHRKQVKETEETKYSNCGRRQVNLVPRAFPLKVGKALGMRLGVKCVFSRGVKVLTMSTGFSMHVTQDITVNSTAKRNSLNFRFSPLEVFVSLSLPSPRK